MYYIHIKSVYLNIEAIKDYLKINYIIEYHIKIITFMFLL